MEKPTRSEQLVAKLKATNSSVLKRETRGRGVSNPTGKGGKYTFEDVEIARLAGQKSGPAFIKTVLPTILDNIIKRGLTNTLREFDKLPIKTQADIVIKLLPYRTPTLKASESHVKIEKVTKAEAFDMLQDQLNIQIEN